MMKNIASIVMLSMLVLGTSISQTMAAVRFLPKTQVMQASTNRVFDTTKNPTFYTPGSCEGKGWLSAVPANQTCSPKYMQGGKKCWSDCKCEAKYTYVSGKGIVGGCPNGQTVNNDSCNGKYSGCIDCSTNAQVPNGWSTTPKSGANVALMTNFGTCANYYYSCNSGYTAASGRSPLSAGPWNWISCEANQKAVNQDGSTDTPKLCQKCVAKTCQDYNADYQNVVDQAMNCVQVNSADVGGLTCWNCIACDTSIYQYDTSNCPTPKIVGTDKCAGKASTCACPATVSCGDGITCRTRAPEGCTGCIECNSCANNGTYTECPTGYVCAKEECSGKYYITRCSINTINIAPNPWYGCWMNKHAK